MPTYYYECEKCGEFHIMQKMSDKKLSKCPKCGKSVKKIIKSIGGVIFKGKGWTPKYHG